jgi:DNA-binding MarR family transcriptional regulator
MVEGSPRPTETSGCEDSSGCADALVDDLGWGLGVLFRAYAKAAQEVVKELPGGPRGYQVLSAAAGGKVTSQLALAQYLGIDRTVMTYLLDDLEQGGLIERRPDPADRRARRVVATKKGAALVSELVERLRATESHLLLPLDDEEREIFRHQVQLLAVRANAADPVENPCAMVTDPCAGNPGEIRGSTRTSRPTRPVRPGRHAG